MEIANRIAIVTGAGAGTGRAIAERLAADGATVVIADVDVQLADETRRAIADAGGRASVVRADMRVGADVEGVIAAAEERHGGLDILVNNAGGGHIGPHFPEASPLHSTATLDLNLRAPILATRLALAPMRRRGGGAVVNIASTAGVGLGPAELPEYAAAKAGLIRFTAAVAGLHEHLGVRVNCVVPDWIATERAKRELAEMTPDERAGAPIPLALEDIAAAVTDFIRNEALTGRVLVMRGGEPSRLLDPD